MRERDMSERWKLLKVQLEVLRPYRASLNVQTEESREGFVDHTHKGTRAPDPIQQLEEREVHMRRVEELGEGSFDGFDCFHVEVVPAGEGYLETSHKFDAEGI